MSRIFFAVLLPAGIRKKIVSLQSRIPVNPEDIKWTEENNLHITLHFVGETSEAKLRQLLQGAEVAADCCRQFTASVKGVGVFPSLASPRVLWAGIDEGRYDIMALARSLSVALGVFPDRRYVPHITLGRVRSENKVYLEDFIRNEKDFMTEKFRVNSFFCMESILTRKGPVYKKVKEIFLKKNK